MREPSARHIWISIAAVLVAADWALCQSEPVVWTSAANVSVSGNSLTKTTGGTAWNAGAASVQVIQAGFGYVEFTATETNTYRACGLSFGDTDQSDADIDFALELSTPDVERSQGETRSSYGAQYPAMVGYSRSAAFRYRR